MLNLEERKSTSISGKEVKVLEGKSENIKKVFLWKKTPQWRNRMKKEKAVFSHLLRFLHMLEMPFLIPSIWVTGFGSGVIS